MQLGALGTAARHVDAAAHDHVEHVAGLVLPRTRPGPLGTSTVVKRAARRASRSSPTLREQGDGGQPLRLDGRFRWPLGLTTKPLCCSQSRA